jgi:hypothetical protein
MACCEGTLGLPVSRERDHWRPTANYDIMAAELILLRFVRSRDSYAFNVIRASMSNIASKSDY